MENKVTEIVFVLDRSGSMSGMESDTIGGFNGLLRKQKNAEGTAYITTVLFNSKYEVLHDHLDIQNVGEISVDDYYARGTTALLDAIGLTINKIDNIVKHSKTDNVIFTIITDGEENASREYNYLQIKNMISNHKEFGWEFLFLGANIDAFSVAEKMGIGRDRSANYHNDSVGVKNNFATVKECVLQFRTCGKLSEGCLDSVKHDYESRD